MTYKTTMATSTKKVIRPMLADMDAAPNRVIIDFSLSSGPINHGRRTLKIINFGL
jgi:hypothetical protein